MATMSVTAATSSRSSRRQKVGLVLTGLLSAGNITSVLAPTPEGEVGPPITVLAIDTALGIIGLVAVVVAWRTGNRAALRVAAGALIISVVTALPAFFVDVPAPLKLFAAAFVLVSIVAVVLMLSSDRRPATVTD